MNENMEYPENQEQEYQPEQAPAAEPAQEAQRVEKEQAYRQSPYQSYQPNWQYQNPYQTYAQPIPPAPKAKKQKKGMTGGKVVALCLCCALIGGAMGTGGAVLASRLNRGSAKTSHSLTYQGNREPSIIDTAQVSTGEQMSPAEVYAANVNSTVGITTSITTNYWGFQSSSAASGSGFIFSDDGYILTNYHVVEGANSITVTMYDGTAYDAALIGYDATNDIAVLKIEATGLTPVVLGDSSLMNVGDPVVAIGNPLGELTFSLTQGGISALDREVTLSSGIRMNLMQTDCAINSGNSGGALFNLYGEVIGITNAKYSGSGSSSEASIDNIGFAIPINTVKGIVTSIIEKGYIAKPYIGVTVENVSAETQRYGLPQGAAITNVVEDSPAEKAGLRENDIITEANGTTISSKDDLGDLVGACSVGDELKLTVYRRGETIELTVTVGEQIQSATESQDSQQQQQQQEQQGGYSFPFGFGFGN